MKKKLFLLCTCFFAYISIAMAQVSKVTGVVISEEDNLPIVGASVLINPNRSLGFLCVVRQREIL